MGNFSLFFLYLIMANVVQSVVIPGTVCANLYHYQVYIYNKLTPDSEPLRTYCASVDKVIGYKALKYEESLAWDLCNFPEKPRTFTCHLLWGSKAVVFESFNAMLAGVCSTHNDCSWYIRPDGVYIEDRKVKDWGNARIA